MWFRKFYSVFCNISKTRNMNLEKCYFRHMESEERIDITFLLKVNEMVRQFNFKRSSSETLHNLLARIGTNVQKAIQKANKRKAKSSLEVEVKMYDDKNNLLPESSTCQELFAMQGPITLKISDHVYEAVFNSPWVVNMALPQSILAGFPVYPEYFVTQYSIKEKSTFLWYTGLSINNKGNEKIAMHIEWHLIWNGFSYTPTAQDVGMKLKLECIPGNEMSTGPAVETISKNDIEAGPGRCPFETRHLFTTSLLNNKSFRCVSYNILADLYCDSDFTRTELHPYCPPYALNIDYRKQLIIKELLGYNADIICLQEVDGKIFDNYLQPILDTKGLDGLFHKKGKEVSEGVACFYRRNRFEVLSRERIVLAEAIQTKVCLEPIWNAIKLNKPLLERLLNRTTIASATVLQSIENPNEIILVGNTHLYFHPDADHIRLLQGGIVIYWLRDLRNNIVKQFPNKRISLILCGDFNSVPSCGIYQLYTSGVAPNSLPDWTSNATEAVSDLSLEQDITLASACGTPPYTNFTDGFADCLDYIFYDKKHIEVEQVVPLPSDEELRTYTALPSIVFPSDHIALVSDLCFK